jgi:uncharacterized protein YjiK
MRWNQPATRRAWRAVGCVLAAGALAGSAPTWASPAEEEPRLNAPHDVGGGLPPGFEPSGAAWQPRLRRVLLVGDEGTIASMDVDGGSVRTWRLAGDLEGICVADPASDRVYVAVERPAAIVEFDLAKGVVLRRFPLPGLEGAGKKHNKGLEAVTFVPDSSDPEGGVFWAGTQSDGSIHLLSLPLRTDAASSTAREIRSFKPVSNAVDLTGLDWDPVTGTIWAVYDKEDRLVVLDRSGRVQASWSLPGKGQEGIAVTPDRIFIADDPARRVVRYERAQHR